MSGSPVPADLAPPSTLRSTDRSALAELLPLLRRIAALDGRSLARLRLTAGAQPGGGAAATATVLALLPFGVLVSRTVQAPPRDRPLDTTVLAAEAVGWLDADAVADTDGPVSRDADWRAGLPPVAGWQRIDSVPDDTVRALVRSGALALRDAARREGVPDAQPRAAVADALLDSVVLTARDDAGHEAAVTLRALSALTRMGFLARGSTAHVDWCGRWIRVAARHGSVYLERPGQQLRLR